MKMTRTWDSTMSMIPKGGDTIWGGFDWSPEAGDHLTMKKKSRANAKLRDRKENKTNVVNYGRMISFGKDVAEADSPEIEILDFRVSIYLTLKLEIDTGSVWIVTYLSISTCISTYETIWESL